MKRYSSYKDSGVEWIGEIPKGWSVKKLKFFGEVTLGKMLTNDDKGGYFLKPYLRSVNIQTERVDVSDVKEMWFSERELEKYRLSKGDLLFNEGGDVGRTCIWDEELEECYIQNSVNRVRVNSSEKYILYHSILHHQTGYYNSVVDRVSIPHLTKEKLELIPFVIPPLSEQQQIVSYLDEQTSLIDTLIQSKQKKITLLKEKRTSLINQIVTKGLNPNVEMKDSGVEWIGEIPRGWSITRVKYLPKDGRNNFIDGDWIESQNITDDGIRYITTGNIGQGYYKEQGNGFISEETFHSLNCSEVFEGDLIISRLSPPVGRSCIIPNLGYRIVTSVDNVILRPKDEYSKYFLNYYFNSIKYYEWTDLISRGTTLTRISRSMLGNNPVITPPLSEQMEIVEYLDKETELIDKTVSIEERKIELLKEYKQSLISEVITGKRKVVSDE
jgi:type I restriction enzyme, S subunit